MVAIGLTIPLQLLLFRQLHPEVTAGFFPARLPFFITLVSLSSLVTFFLASLFISLVFMRHRELIGRLYFFDLFGAAIGCAVFFILLRSVGVEYSNLILAAVVIVASLLLVPRISWRAGVLWAGAIGVVAATGFSIRGPSPLAPFVGRELRMLYQYQEQAKLEFQRWDPVARIDITSVPGHVLHLPDTTQYKLLTQDGGAPSILLGFDRPFEELEFPERSLLGIAYWVRQADSVLIIGPGGRPRCRRSTALQALQGDRRGTQRDNDQGRP